MKMSDGEGVVLWDLCSFLENYEEVDENES